MTGAVVTLLLFPLIGLALSRLVGRMQPFAAGAGVTGLVLYAGELAGLPLRITGLATLAAAIGILLWKRRQQHQPRVRYPIVPGIIALIPLVWLVITTAIVPLHDFDGRAFWLLKAKAIAHEDSITGPFFHGASTSPRNAYPLLLPLDTALVMDLAGERDDRHVRLFFVLFILALALELRRRIGALTSPATGAWMAAITLWMPQLLVEIEGGATSAYADIAVGMFVAGAFFELLDRESPLRFGLWISFLLLTKSEGLPFALLLFTLGIVVFRRSILPAAIPLAGALALLFGWRGGISRSDELDFASLILSLPAKAERFVESLGATASQFAAVHDWGLLPIAFVVAVVVLLWSRRWRELLLPGAIMLPMLLLYAGVFAVSDWDMSVMSDNLAPRVVTHLIAPIMWVIASASVASSVTGDRQPPATSPPDGSARS